MANTVLGKIVRFAYIGMICFLTCLAVYQTANFIISGSVQASVAIEKTPSIADDLESKWNRLDFMVWPEHRKKLQIELKQDLITSLNSNPLEARYYKKMMALEVEKGRLDEQGRWLFQMIHHLEGWRSITQSYLHQVCSYLLRREVEYDKCLIVAR